MSSLPPPPPLPRPASESEEENEPPKRTWRDRLLNNIGLILAGLISAVAILQLARAMSIPLPDVPADASRLKRIEALAERANAIALANQHLILMVLYAGLGVMMFGLGLKIETLRSETEQLMRENEELQERIIELEDKDIADAQRALEDARAKRRLFPGSLFASSLRSRRSLFDDDDKADDDPLFPPKVKPPYLN
jgi:hypothetical protein